MTPTEEQLAVIEAARTTEDNILVSALAGAAKTTTLVLIAEALPATSILCLAFNKRIADEMKLRLPENCTPQTLNSLGHRVWRDSCGRNLRLEPSKVYNLATEVIEDLPQEERGRAYGELSEIIRIVKRGKSEGFVPDDTPRMRSLVDAADFFASLDEEIEEWMEELVIEISRRSIREAWQGRIDYDDQILMPTLGPGSFPRFPLVLIDEAQDLSPLNHAMLQKVAKRRLIAVGDRNQAIYGFRGASENSMDELAAAFAMRELTLSISFRCPRAVVTEARFRAPHMQWPDWAAEGEVRRLATWSPADIPDNAAILCRNNAPLFSLALKLLKAGRYPQISGNDIGKSLIKVMKKFGPASLPQAEVLTAIDEWKTTKLVRARNKATITDQAECMTIFAEAAPNLGDAIAVAEHIFEASGPIKLMTVHKSKGLEYHNVFLLDSFLIGKGGQEPNIRYVAVTRAMSTLTYIRSEDFHAND